MGGKPLLASSKAVHSGLLCFQFRHSFQPELQRSLGTGFIAKFYHFCVQWHTWSSLRMCCLTQLRATGLISWLCIKQCHDPKLTSCPAYNVRAHACVMLLSLPLPFPACSALQSAGYNGQGTWAAPGPCAESHSSTTGNFLLRRASV